MTKNQIVPTLEMMRSRNELNDPTEASTYRELRLLSEVDREPEASQRDLARRVGIALGVTNVLLRNLGQKGYVRVTHAGWKRWLYTLTPEGFSRKVQLTVGYIHRTLDHYRTVRETLREQIAPLALNEESRIAIYGTGEFAELVYLGLKEIGIEEMDVFGPGNGANGKFLGMPVYDVSGLTAEHYDRIVFAMLDAPEAVRREFRELQVGPEKLVTFFQDNASGEGA